MKQIVEIGEIEKLGKQLENKRIVLAGGCFDVVHLGHIIFLEKAKSKGDVLVILLESDIDIKKNKGKNRPINNQENRAIFLTKLKMVDYVIKLPEMKTDEEYFKIISKLKPKIIAVSENDKNLDKKKEQAKRIGAKLVEVTKTIPQQSTSKIIEDIISYL
jgi:rfaE bifunctional protein nucleotidyltransferase chain/domain